MSQLQLVLFDPSNKYDEAIDLSLRLSNVATKNMNFKNKNNKRMFRCTCEDDQEQEDTVRAKKLKKFSFYTREEEAQEKLNGVSTKLKLFDDPWKIKKVLETSDVNSSCRLMISKKLVQQHIIKVWERDGRDEDLMRLRGGVDVRVKVWDCNRGKEYELTMKQHVSSSECYVICGNWKSQFVKERGLKKGDEIGLFWCNVSGSFFFSVLALAPAPNQPFFLFGGVLES